MVENDIPAVVGSATVTIHVDEDNLSAAAGDGDLSTGIDDGADGQTRRGDVYERLARRPGHTGCGRACEFSLNLTVLNGAVTAIGGAAVLSAGKAVLWGADGSTLFGFADQDGSGTFNAGDRDVFTLTNEGSGNFKFDLKDQLDHSGAENDNENLMLNLTSAFTAERLRRRCGGR